MGTTKDIINKNTNKTNGNKIRYERYNEKHNENYNISNEKS